MKLDSWIPCSEADEVAPDSDRASDIDEVWIDSDGGLVVGCIIINVPVWVTSMLGIGVGFSDAGGDQVEISGNKASVDVPGRA